MGAILHNCSNLSQAFPPVYGTNVHPATAMLRAMRNSTEIAIRNIEAAMAELGIDPTKLAELSGVSRRHIVYLLKRERQSPSIAILDDLAKALGLEPWHLFMPTFDAKKLRGKRLDKIVDAFMSADEAGSASMTSHAEFIKAHTSSPPNNASPHKNRIGGVDS